MTSVKGEVLYAIKALVVLLAILHIFAWPIVHQEVGNQVGQWECVVNESDGDELWCTAHLIGGTEEDVESWALSVPGNKWVEGDVFYVLKAIREPVHHPAYTRMAEMFEDGGF